MGRREDRLFKLNDELQRLQRELQQARSELDVHRSLADDASRDAAVFDTPLDREDERETTADVARFQRVVNHLEDRLAVVIAKRDKLLRKLG